MARESDYDRTGKQPKFAFPGAGDIVRFWCPKCAQSKRTVGRRMKHHRGLRTWLCADCVKPKGA